MNPHHHGDPADNARIDEAAAEWLVKRDRGFTPTEQDQFLQWLAADQRHGEWLARHQQTWQQFNLLAEWRPEHGAEPNPDLLARPRRVRRAPPTLWLAAAAAVALLLAGGVTWQAFRGGDAAIGAVAPAYERRVLTDGSVLELNRGAAVDLRFTDAERRVELKSGEAHFTVAKNPHRPFVVDAAGVGVRAVGTAFNVRLDAAAVEVLVTEGRVEVWQAGGSDRPSSLVAGQRAIVRLDDAAELDIAAVSPGDMAKLLAWQPQTLDFSSTPLAQVVAEFNRRNRTQLVIADPELGAVPIVASFRSDSLDAFVRLLEITADVRAERRGENVIVLRRAR